jgi:hypothetical protein
MDSPQDDAGAPVAANEGSFAPDAAYSVADGECDDGRYEAAVPELITLVGTVGIAFAALAVIAWALLGA